MLKPRLKLCTQIVLHLLQEYTYSLHYVCMSACSNSRRAKRILTKTDIGGNGLLQFHDTLEF
jgi:hypothetical protein